MKLYEQFFRILNRVYKKVIKKYLRAKKLRKRKRIRQRAYELWEIEGKPINKSKYYWFKAVEQLKSESFHSKLIKAVNSNIASIIIASILIPLVLTIVQEYQQTYRNRLADKLATYNFLSEQGLIYVDTFNKLIILLEDLHIQNEFISYQLMPNEDDNFLLPERVKDRLNQSQKLLRKSEESVSVLENYFNRISDFSSPPQYNSSGKSYINLVREGQISSKLINPINWFIDLILKENEVDISSNTERSGDGEELSSDIYLPLFPEARISILDEQITDILEPIESISKGLNTTFIEYSRSQLRLFISHYPVDDQVSEKTIKKHLFCKEISNQLEGKTLVLKKEMENIQLSLVGTNNLEKVHSVANYFGKNHELMKKYLKIIEIAKEGICQPVNRLVVK